MKVFECFNIFIKLFYKYILRVVRYTNIYRNLLWIHYVYREVFKGLVEIFTVVCATRYVYRTKHLEISLTLQRDSTVVIILAKFETNVKGYVETTTYSVHICISQRLQKYLNNQLFGMLMSLYIQ